MKTLTKREKTLIYILAYVLIVIVGIFMLCLPMLETNTSLKSERDQMEQEWLLTKSSEVTYEGLDKKVENATNEYNAQLGNFYILNETYTEDIDKLITSLMLKFNLTPTSLEVGQVAEEKLINYEQYLAQAKESAKNNGSTTSTSDENANSIKVFNVSMKVTGTVSNLQAMVNESNTMKALKVTEVGYSSSSNSKSNPMTVSFVVYMI